jgi:hypothetical protein
MSKLYNPVSKGKWGMLVWGMLVWSPLAPGGSGFGGFSQAHGASGQAAQLAQPGNGLTYRLNGKLDFFGRVEPPQAESQAGASQIVIQL